LAPALQSQVAGAERFGAANERKKEDSVMNNQMYVSRKVIQAAVGFGVAWVFGISLLVSGCAKSSPTATATPIVDGLSLVDGKMQGAALLQNAQGVALGKTVKQTLFARLFGIASAEALPFNGQWDAPGTVNGLNWTPVSIKEYLGESLDSGFVNPNGANVTVFGRFRNSVRMLCAIDLIVPNKDPSGLPANGTYSVTIPVGPGTELSQKCKGFENEKPQTITGTVTVSTPSPSTYYDKALVLTTSGGGSAPDSMPLLLKLDAQTIRIATAEIEDDHDARNRSFLEYDKATDVLRFEYLSQGFDANSGVELHRIYIDGQAEQAFLLSDSGGDGVGGYSGYVRFTAAGNPNDANRTSIAVSVGFDQQAGGNNVADLNACAKASDGSILADDSLACQVTGQPISSATAIDASFAAHATSADITLDASMTISFHDASDVYTAVSQ
jgi:hypothetical protein